MEEWKKWVNTEFLSYIQTKYGQSKIDLTTQKETVKKTK